MGVDLPPQHIIPPDRLIPAAPASLLHVPIGKTYVPTSSRKRILNWGHSSLLAGHSGSQKSIALISRHYWWPNLARDVSDFVRACEVCARNKTSRLKPSGLLLPLPVPDSPWDHIAMDFITDLPPSSNYTVIWVVIDRFSKMAHFTPLIGLPTAVQLASLFFHHIFRLHGLPLHIVSDRGVQFISKFWRALCNRLKIKLDFSSAYHPQSNGQAERVNQILGTYLRHFVSASQDNWSSLLPWAEFSYNYHVSSSTGSSPFFVVYGHHPRPPLPLPISSEVPAVDSLVRDFQSIWKNTQHSLTLAASRMKAQADKKRRPPPAFLPGDKVWLSAKYVRLKQPSYKLGPRFLGPFKILSQVNPVAYKLLLPRTLRIPNTFHVSLLKPVVLNRFSSKSTSSSPVAGASDIFEVQQILASKVSRGRRFFLVDWKGFGPEERSWEPEGNILDKSLIRDFLLSQKKGGPKGGGTVAARAGSRCPARGRLRLPSRVSGTKCRPPGPRHLPGAARAPRVLSAELSASSACSVATSSSGPPAASCSACARAPLP